jgi:formylmethanofuran dehydrogenase subunit E
MVGPRDDGEPRIDPDDYRVCYACGEQAHVDDVVLGMAQVVCRWCWEKEENEYDCFKCNDSFRAVGIPLKCSRCGSEMIDHEYAVVTGWIHQAQREAERESMDKFRARVLSINSQ